MSRDLIKEAEQHVAEAEERLKVAREELTRAKHEQREPYPVGTIVQLHKAGTYLPAIMAIRLDSFHSTAARMYNVSPSAHPVWLTMFRDGSGSVYKTWDDLRARFHDYDYVIKHMAEVSWT